MAHSYRSSIAVFAGLALVAASSSLASGCVDDPTPPAANLSLDSGVFVPPEAAVPDVVLPPFDASGVTDGAAFASGFGAGATVTKSAKYTLITKTGGSPGGHGVSKSPAHTNLSGVAAGTKQ